MPLDEYCKKNNLNINTIRTRIWKKKQSEKYKDYSDEKIINLVIESTGSGIKYMYKGVN